MPGPDRYPIEKFVKSISTNIGTRFPKADRNLRPDFEMQPDQALTYLDGSNGMNILRQP